MWPYLIPAAIGAGISGLQAYQSSGGDLGKTLGATLLGGGLGAGAGAAGVGAAGLTSRMAGSLATAPAVEQLLQKAVTNPSGLSALEKAVITTANIAKPAAPMLGAAAGFGTERLLSGAVPSIATALAPSTPGLANAALGAGGLAYNQMQPRPTGNVPAYQPPDISRYGPNGPYGTIATENPLGPPQGSLRYQLDQGRTWDEINKITQPYVQQVARQAYDEEMQRQAASYQQKSAVNTAATMLAQAQLGGQQAGLNAQQAMNNAISGPQRSYF